MKSQCRAVLAGIALLGTAFALTACGGNTRSMIENDAKARAARHAAQGNPQFSDPQLQAVVKKFEADYALFGIEAEKLGLEQGTPCPATREAAFRTLFGTTPEGYEQTQSEFAQKAPGYTAIADPDSVHLVTLSGVCGVDGPDGPAVVVGTKRTIVRLSGESFSNVTVTDSVVRIDATWVGGQAHDKRSVIQMSQSTPFKETKDGQLAENIDDWDYINTIRTAPSASYSYTVPNPDGTTRYDVSFSRSEGAGDYGTMVLETRDAHHTYLRSWQGTELRSEGGQKDGKQHGWQIIHPTVYNGTETPGRRDCYQNGELIKALECPFD